MPTEKAYIIAIANILSSLMVDLARRGIYTDAEALALISGAVARAEASGEKDIEGVREATRLMFPGSV